MDEGPFPDPEHDHRACVERAVARAKDICAQKDVRLTALREAVLRVLLSSHTALGAYDIIEKLTSYGRRLAPISVYRIMDVLVSAGLAHRLESKNAFFACLSEHETKNPIVIMLCGKCKRVAEAEAAEAWSVIGALTRENEFSISAMVLEVHGTCRHCRKAKEKAA